MFSNPFRVSQVFEEVSRVVSNPCVAQRRGFKRYAVGSGKAFMARSACEIAYQVFGAGLGKSVSAEEKREGPEGKSDLMAGRFHGRLQSKRVLTNRTPGIFDAFPSVFVLDLVIIEEIRTNNLVATSE